jgi:predicted NBD/HSP70 family sugar kinase
MSLRSTHVSTQVMPTRQVASNRTPRHINSKVVLNIIRRHQPISRADLARSSGLQASTISLIVEDLIASRWVLEGEVANSSRGRKPMLLSLNDQRCVIALDIHPSQTTVAVTDLGGRIVAQSVVSLPEEPGMAIGTMTRAIRQMISAHPDRTFEGVGICLPGRTDAGARDLIFAPNLRWPVVNLKARMERDTGLPIAMDNVANACALSEVWFGDSDGSHDLVVVEVSEGLGAGIFVNQGIARGQHGMAGEFGHIQMAEDGPLCNCGNRGCWETLASNPAAVRFYEEIEGHQRQMTFSRLLRLANSKDTRALAALERMAVNLGRGMRMIVAALAPTEIIVVGEITSAWHVVGPAVEKAMMQSPLGRNTRVRPTYDGASARLRSAVALVLAQRSFDAMGGIGIALAQQS